MIQHFSNPFKGLIQLFQNNASSSPILNQNNNDITHSVQRIPFSDQLISTLQAEHKQLVVLYRHIAQTAQAEQFTEIPKQIIQLKREFNRNILQSNVHFYRYLEQHFAEDSAQLEHIQSYKNEINSFVNRFNKFMHTWQYQHITLQNIQQFQNEYNSMGDLLSKHINHEESHFYPLYQQA